MSDNDFSYEEKMAMVDAKLKAKVIDCANELMDLLNGMGSEKKVSEAFIYQVNKSHRTLQQNFFGHILIPLIKDFARRYDEGNYDLRNEASCKCAKDIEKVIKDVGFPFI